MIFGCIEHPVYKNFNRLKSTKLMEFVSRVYSSLKQEIGQLVNQGGPNVQDYQHVDNLMIRLSNQFRSGLLTEDELTGLRNEFGVSLSNSTMQGFMFNKPHGYAGDYEIIERMYSWYVSPNTQCSKWDLYLQNHAASRAVRNRKTYFKQALKSYLHRHNLTEIRLLNLASGPCTELAEFLQENPGYRLITDCVDVDPQAIRYAKRKLAAYGPDIQFIQKNIFRFTPTSQYDLIWSAGLFDYFNDKQFVQLISRFSKNLAPQGEMIIGNFADGHPSQYYMDLVDWQLNYRSEAHLLQLGREAVQSANEFHLRVGREPERVNLFLHLERWGEQSN